MIWYKMSYMGLYAMKPKQIIYLIHTHTYIIYNMIWYNMSYMGWYAIKPKQIIYLIHTHTYIMYNTIWYNMSYMGLYAIKPTNHTDNRRESLRDVWANVLESNTWVRVFELQLGYYIYYWTNTFVKGIKSLSTRFFCSSTWMAFALNNPLTVLTANLEGDILRLEGMQRKETKIIERFQLQGGIRNIRIINFTWKKNER